MYGAFVWAGRGLTALFGDFHPGQWRQAGATAAQTAAVRGFNDLPQWFKRSGWFTTNTGKTWHNGKGYNPDIARHTTAMAARFIGEGQPAHLAQQMAASWAGGHVVPFGPPPDDGRMANRMNDMNVYQDNMQMMGPPMMHYGGGYGKGMPPPMPGLPGLAPLWPQWEGKGYSGAPGSPTRGARDSPPRGEAQAARDSQY